jgi:hypothetical protein
MNNSRQSTLQIAKIEGTVSRSELKYFLGITKKFSNYLG